jgi:hypothetical protein
VIRPVKRRQPGIMNGTERAYANLLEQRVYSGVILSWRYEPFRMRLADWKCTYTPDFLVVHEDRFEIVEVKGFRRDDAMSKFRMAASIYPWFIWRMVGFKKKEWNTILEILP